MKRLNDRKLRRVARKVFSLSKSLNKRLGASSQYTIDQRVMKRTMGY